MKRHVSILGEEIDHYFPNLEQFDKYYCFINTPFALAVEDLPSTDHSIQEQFIDLINDRGAKLAFPEMCCTHFWIEMAQSYPNGAKMALKLLIPFATTYECEAAFPTLLNFKLKSRDRLNVTHDMRVALSKTQPKIEELVEACIHHIELY